MLAIGIVAIVVCGIALAIGLYIHDYMESYMLTPLPLFVPTILPQNVSIPQGESKTIAVGFSYNAVVREPDTVSFLSLIHISEPTRPN